MFKSIKCVLLVLTVLAVGVWYASMAKAEIVTEGIVSCWDFDNIEGNTVVDICGGNDGTIHEAPNVVDGKIGKALEFDGAGDHVIVEDNASLDIENAITLQVWIKPYQGSSTADLRIVTKPHTNWGDPWEVYSLNMPGHIPRFRISDNIQNHTLDGAVALSMDEWYNLAGTYDGSSLILYQNGEIIGPTSYKGDIDTNDEDLWIGGHPLNPERYFEGIIDEIYIYNRALSQAEIQQNYESEVGIPSAVEPAEKLTLTWGKIKVSR